jgi:hypothetical protein
MTEIISKEFKQRLRDALTEAIDTSLDDVIDAYLQDYLEECSCWLDFTGGKISVTIGLGPNDACRSFTELKDELDPYGYLGGPRSQVQQDDILERIDGLRSFIAELEEARGELERQAEAFKAKGAA